jgi:hypothetical protein
MNLGYLKTIRAMGAIQQQDHADGCACDACADARAPFAIAPDPELIHVGLPYLSDANNGFARAGVSDGNVWVTVKGMGVGELSMPANEARAFRDQLSRAIEQL